MALDGEHGFDQPDDPCRDIQVADVALHGPQRAPAACPRAGPPKRGGERGHLDRIAQRRAGPVRFDVADRVGRHARQRLRLHDHGGLPGDARRRVAHLVRAVVVDRRAQNHRVHQVAGGDRVAQPFQQDDAGAVADDGAGRLRVERPAVAVGREDHPLLVEVAGFLRQAHGGAAGQGHVALAVEERLTRHVHGHERGRTCRLHVDARARQIELIREARCDEVALARDERLIRGTRIGVRDRRLHVSLEVAAVGDTGEDPDACLTLERAVPRMLQRVPRTLEHKTMLRIEQRRFARGIAEERGIERLDAGDEAARRNVARVARERRRDARRAQVLFRQERDRLARVHEIVPERLDVLGARNTAGHADDGDSRIGRSVRLGHQAPVLSPRPGCAADGVGGGTRRVRRAARSSARAMLASSVSSLGRWPAMWAASAATVG